MPGSTATNTGGSVEVRYGSGSFSGKEYVDRVTVGGLTVQKQSIGSAIKSIGFDGVDGYVEYIHFQLGLTYSPNDVAS